MSLLLLRLSLLLLSLVSVTAILRLFYSSKTRVRSPFLVSEVCFLVFPSLFRCLLTSVILVSEISFFFLLYW
jgi:hypothetical protein